MVSIAQFTVVIKWRQRFWPFKVEKSPVQNISRENFSGKNFGFVAILFWLRGVIPSISPTWCSLSASERGETALVSLIKDAAFLSQFSLRGPILDCEQSLYSWKSVGKNAKQVSAKGATSRSASSVGVGSPARLAACDIAVTVTVTLPCLFCFVVSVAHNGEFERFCEFCVVVTDSTKPTKSFEFAIVSHRNDIPHQPTDVILLIFLAYNKVVTRCKIDVSLRY